MPTSDIALTRPDATLTMDTLRAQMEAAKRFVDSGLLPSGIRTPQQALTIMQAGREVGVPPTYALRNIHVIEGKPSCSAELLMALVRRTYGQSAIRVKDATTTACTVEYREAGWDGVSSLTFSIEDARSAGLADKAMWKKYPRAMLRSRAVSEAVRTAFPECIAGLYTPEELGADVVVASDGSIEIRDVVEGEVVNQHPFAVGIRAGGMTPASAAEPATSSGQATNGTSAEDDAEEPPFKYANVQERYKAAAEYDRLTHVAIEKGHRRAAAIRAKGASQLSDEELAVAIDKLLTWEASLAPAPEQPELVDAF